MKPVIPEGHTAEFEHMRLRTGWNHYVATDGKIDPDARPGMSDYVRPQDGYSVESKGGVTMCKIKDAEGNVVSMGESRCHTNDNFNKRIGRDISLGRALKRLRVSA